MSCKPITDTHTAQQCGQHNSKLLNSEKEVRLCASSLIQAASTETFFFLMRPDNSSSHKWYLHTGGIREPESSYTFNNMQIIFIFVFRFVLWLTGTYITASSKLAVHFIQHPQAQLWLSHLIMIHCVLVIHHERQVMTFQSSGSAERVQIQWPMQGSGL